MTYTAVKSALLDLLCGAPIANIERLTGHELQVVQARVNAFFAAAIEHELSRHAFEASVAKLQRAMEPAE